MPLQFQLSQCCYPQSFAPLWDNASATSAFSKLLSPEPRSIVEQHFCNLSFLKVVILHSLVPLWGTTSATSDFSKLLSPKALSSCGTTPLQPQLYLCILNFSQSYYPHSFVPLWDDAFESSAFSKLLSPRALWDDTLATSTFLKGQPPWLVSDLKVHTLYKYLSLDLRGPLLHFPKEHLDVLEPRLAMVGD